MYETTFLFNDIKQYIRILPTNPTTPIVAKSKTRASLVVKPTGVKM